MLGTLDKIRTLRRVDLFGGLVMEDLAEISRIAHPESFREGTLVFGQGDPGVALYVIIAGSVELFLDQKTGPIPLAELRPHAYFGEMALLDDKPRSASARAKEILKVLRIGKEEFRDLLKEHSELGLDLLRLLSLRIRKFQAGKP